MLLGKDPIKTRESDSKDDRLREMRERAEKALIAWKHNFDAAREDIAFLAGNQWSERVRKEREDEGRPILTLNKLPQYVDQVLGDQRQNRPAIHVHPVEADKKADTEKVPNVAGTNDYTLAEIYEGLIRNIEYTSNAEAHYDTAFQHAVEGGFGWLRVITKYSTDDAFDLDLCIKSVHNRFSVLMDPDAKEPDYSDANWGFVSEKIPTKEFDKRYPGKQRGDLGDTQSGWWSEGDDVRVAEYFYREPVTRTLLLLSDGRAVWEDEVEAVLDELQDMGVTITRTRKVKTYKVKWMLVTAYDILEKETDWPGSTIPVIPVFGKESVVEDKTYYRGLIRHGKDAQSMHNYWMTAATERVALAPKAPWVAPAEAIEGYEQLWENANRSNIGVLTYNAIPGIDRPQREQPPGMPAAELQLARSGTDELKETLGLYDASLGAQGNETSGKAIVARQRQGDRGTFAYIDNLSRAIRRVGQVLIELIPAVYDGERIIRLRFQDGEGDWVQINQMIMDEETQKPVLVRDIAAGKFDATVKAGPSYQTQRIEAADSMVQFVQAVPAAGAVTMDLMAKNMDWPGADDYAKRLMKILPPGILTEKEMQDAGIEAPQPTGEQQAAMEQAQADTKKAEATIATAEATMAMADAKAKEAQAKIMEAEAKMAELQAMTGVADPGVMEETVRNMVADALAEFMAQQQERAAMQQQQPQQDETLRGTEIPL